MPQQARGGRPRKAQATRRSVRLMAHVTPGDAQLIRALAMEQGRSVSECLTASTLSQARVPVARSSRSTPEFRELRRELSPVGNNINQLTRQVHKAAARDTADAVAGETSGEVVQVLAASQQQLARLEDVLNRLLEQLVAQ